MRLSKTDHLQRPWRIHHLAPEFDVEDVWALPAEGGSDDFRELVAMMVAGDPLRGGPRLVRLLTALREKLGARAGLDGESSGIGSRVGSLSDRLPSDLRETDPPTFQRLPFRSLYLLDDEFAAEAANRTMHGILHLGWVQDASGGYHGQMAVLVNPNGWLGKAYMAAIKPARHLIVYPALMRSWGRSWERRPRRRGPAHPAHDPRTTN